MDPYVATPLELVRAKLELAQVTSQDLIYDLGCGDGRVLIMAAQEFGARGVGVEIQRDVVELAWSEVADHELEDLIEIRCEDYFETDLSQADVVVLYLRTHSLHRLSDRLLGLKSGARVVTHDFPLAGLELSEQQRFSSSEGDSMLYLYQIAPPEAR